MPRKLTEKVASAMKLMSATDEPQVQVPQVNKAATLAEIATQGIEAVNKLAEERTATAALAANLHLRNEMLLMENQRLREEMKYHRDRAGHLAELNSNLRATIDTARNLFGQISGYQIRTNQIIDALPIPTPLSNNLVTNVDADGLPIEDLTQEEEAPQLKLNEAAPIPDADELRALVARINGSPTP